MPIAAVNTPTVTVNSVLVENLVVSASVNAQGQLTVSARAVLRGGRSATTPGPGRRKWTPAGPRKSVFIPDVSNSAGNPATADLAGLQLQFTAAFTAVETALAAVNQTRQLV